MPTTKRITGPKLSAAGAPTKCRPGTEDSRPRPSTRVALLDLQLRAELGSDERVAPHVDVIAGAKQHVVDKALGPVVEAQAQPLALRVRADHASREHELGTTQPVRQPFGARRDGCSDR